MLPPGEYKYGVRVNNESIHAEFSFLFLGQRTNSSSNSYELNSYELLPLLSLHPLSIAVKRSYVFLSRFYVFNVKKQILTVFTRHS